MKPLKKNIEYYSYFDCKNYITEKYNIADKQEDFWRFIVQMDRNIYDVSYFTMYERWESGATEIERRILKNYMDEFGEGEVGDRKILFWFD